jgi:GntR family transcriptional regulator, transcriptional repressor for pyruvate dehydrogenase complex
MPTFKKVNPPLRMPEAIVRQIEDKILLGRLKPDQMLPPENELMKEFGVGRNTVREALRILETSGLIKVRQGARGGPVVTKFTTEFVSDFLTKAIRLRGVSPDHLAEFRLGLEPSIAEILATKENINPELLLQMEENIVEVRRLYKAHEVTAYGNMDFHVLLALATENPMFIIVLKTLRVGFNLVSPPQNRIQIQTIKYHETIFDAIKRRDPATAREQMYRHLVEMRELFREAKVRNMTHVKGRNPRPSSLGRDA